MTRSAKSGFTLVVVLAALLLIGRLLEIGVKPQAAEPNGPSFNIGKTESRNSTSSSSTSSSADNSTFSARRILLISADNAPFNQRITRLLAQHLQEHPRVEQVEVRTLDRELAGGNAPDLFARVEVADLDKEGLLSHSLKCTVKGFLGGTPWQGSHYTRTPDTPPLVQFRWNAIIEHQSTFKGVRSDPYAEPARSIAAELFKGMSNQISSFAEKFPPLPALPREFFGPYEPVSDFDFLKELKAERVCSYYGLLTHNETYWKFQMPTNPVPVLERILTQLQNAQWKHSDGNLTNTWDYYLAFRRDGALLEIFRAENNDTVLDSDAPPAEIEFIAHYQKPFAKAEREAALEILFAQMPSLETLLPFRHSLSSTQREKFYARLESAPATTPRAYLALTEVYLARKQTNAALNTLLRAQALADLSLKPAGLSSQIESFAKKISPKEKLKLEVTPEICRELGFLEITGATEPVELERNYNEPLILFGASERGLKMVSCNVESTGKDAGRWILIQAEKGMRSSSVSAFNTASPGQFAETLTIGGQKLRFSARPLPEVMRVKYRVQQEGAMEPPPAPSPEGKENLSPSMSDAEILRAIGVEAATLTIGRTAGKDGYSMSCSNETTLVFITRSLVSGVIVTRLAPEELKNQWIPGKP